MKSPEEIKAEILHLTTTAVLDFIIETVTRFYSVPPDFPMKIFVTGGTGFIGGHFLKQSIAAGHEVLALRRGRSKTRVPLPWEPAWLEGDLDADWSKKLSQCAVLVHFAAVGVSPQRRPRARNSST